MINYTIRTSECNPDWDGPAYRNDVVFRQSSRHDVCNQSLRDYGNTAQTGYVGDCMKAVSSRMEPCIS